MRGSVVLASQRVGLINECLNGGDLFVVLEAKQRAAFTSGRPLNAELAIGHVDSRTASGAIDLQQDIIKLAGHSAIVHRSDAAEKQPWCPDADRHRDGVPCPECRR